MVSFYFLVRCNRPFSAGIMWNADSSLHHRRNPLTPASYVCEAAPRPLLRVTNRFTRIRDFPYLKLGIRDLKAKPGRDSELKVRAGGGMPKITLGITGLRVISGRDYGIENPIGDPPCSGPTTDSQQSTGSSFRISFHFDWQIDSGIF